MMRFGSPITLAYCILVGPILWFVHFFTVYALSEFGCRANFTNWQYIAPETIRWLTIGLTIPVVILIGAGGVLAYRGWRLPPPEGVRHDQYELQRFLLLIGLLFSGIFVFSILYTILPSFFLDVCDRAV